MSNLSEEEQRANKHMRDKLRLDILYKEGDVKKIEHKKQEVEQAISRLKHEQVKLEMEFSIEEKKLKDLASEHMQLQQEIIKMKHEMNSLHF